MELHPDGARVVTSSVPVKSPYMATVKNCNYLPNVLMVKDARDRDADFAVGFDVNGCLAEGATENIGIVTHDRRLLFPRLDGILKGTTMIRVMELAETLKDTHILSAIGFGDIRREDITNAMECLIVGTTRNVTSVVLFDGRPVGDGRPGPIARELNRLLEQDILTNSHLRTSVWT
jgi:branched-chain amino acid aminotransferase